MARAASGKSKTTKTAKKAPAAGKSRAKKAAPRATANAKATSGAKRSGTRRPAAAAKGRSGVKSSAAKTVQSVREMIPLAVAAAKEMAQKGMDFVESHIPSMGGGKKGK